MNEPLSETTVGALDPRRFEHLLDAEHVAQLREGMAEALTLLDHRVVWHVNSTARGGGVAEMLHPLLAYAKGAGVDARWLVVGGDQAFFRITKRLHNRLHGAIGDGGALGDAERAQFEQSLAAPGDALLALVHEQDAVILHDPQTAGLIPRLRAAGVTVVWRCHIGVDPGDERASEAQEFLLPYIREADSVVFSRGAYVWPGVDPGRVAILSPTIDAFSPKNQDLAPGAAAAILEEAGLRAAAGSERTEPRYLRLDGTPATVSSRAHVLGGGRLPAGARYVLQVSRWDALKDPLGVIQGFADHILPATDAHLVHAGPDVSAVADDPEGAAVLEQAHALWSGLPREARARIHLALLPMDDLEENAAIVNALQREAAVVVQKSLAEGFGLTVCEAMWKSRPVVASRIGGIQDQIEHGRSGVLLDDPYDLAAYGEAVRGLLGDPERAAALGAAARERVRDLFLGSQSLLGYLGLLRRLL